MRCYARVGLLRKDAASWALGAAAEAAGLSVRSASKWLARYRAEGELGLYDRPWSPRSIPHRTPEDRVDAIAVLRRLRMTGAEIAECLGMALSTVSESAAGHDRRAVRVTHELVMSAARRRCVTTDRESFSR